jgi:hypothetical protein
MAFWIKKMRELHIGAVYIVPRGCTRGDSAFIWVLIDFSPDPVIETYKICTTNWLLCKAARNLGAAVV